MSLPQHVTQRVNSARPRKTPDGGVADTVESLMLLERTKWAMRVHDSLTQSVTSAILELQSLRHRILSDPVDAIASIKLVETEIRKDLSEIREILFELDEGERREEPSLARFVAEVVERWKLPARVSVEGDMSEVPPHVEEVAHGIIAEALANAAKHSGSPEVGVRVRAGAGELCIEVEDRGHGIGSTNTSSGDEDAHFGLRQMRARVHELHGTLEIESAPGSGTRVVVRLPVSER